MFTIIVFFTGLLFMLVLKACQFLFGGEVSYYRNLAISVWSYCTIVLVLNYISTHITIIIK